MPNRKIKHITATLTGASSAETFDIYDEAAHLPERDIAIFTDSYGSYNGGDGALTYNIKDRLEQYLDWSQATIYYSPLNGASFCAGDFQTMLEAMTVPDGSTIKDVYVLGGWNDELGRDGRTESAFYDAIIAFRQTALSKFPNARCHLLFTPWGYRSSNTMQNLRATQSWYQNANKCGWCTHDNFAYVMHRTDLFWTGGVHPNQYGVNEIAKNLANVILTDHCDIEYETLQTKDDMDGTPYGIAFPSAMTARITSRLYNGIVLWDWYLTNGTLARYNTGTTWHCDGTSEYNLFDLTGTHIIKGYYNNAYAGITVTVKDTSYSVHTVTGKLSICDNVVKFLPDYIPRPQASLADLTFTALDITIPSFRCVLPAI